MRNSSTLAPTAIGSRFWLEDHAFWPVISCSCQLLLLVSNSVRPGIIIIIV